MMAVDENDNLHFTFTFDLFSFETFRWEPYMMF